LSPTSAKPGKPICKMLIGPMAPRHSNLNPYENTTGPITKRNLERHKGIPQMISPRGVIQYLRGDREEKEPKWDPNP